MKTHLGSLIVRSSGLLATLLLAACGNDPATVASAAPSAKAASSSTALVRTTASAAPSAAPAAPAFTPDPDVVKLVKAVATGCKIDADAFPRDCKANETDALYRYAGDKKPESFYATAADLALGEGAKDPQVFRAALYAFNFVPDDVEWLQKNATPATAERTLKLLPLVDEQAASVFGTSASALLLLAGKRAEETAFLMKDAKPDIQAHMFAGYLRYGGVAAIDDVRAATKLPNRTTRYDAASAVSYAMSSVLGGSHPLSDADHATMCDFAKELVASSDEAVVGGASDSLARCKGPYIDFALQTLGARAESDKPTRQLSDAIYHQCWAEGVVGGAMNGSKEQCAKAIDILEKMADAKGIDDDALAGTLFSIGYVSKNGGPDLTKRGKAILAKFAGNKSKSVSDAAKFDYFK